MTHTTGKAPMQHSASNCICNKQVKVIVAANVAAAFKTECITANVSIVFKLAAMIFIG